MARYKRITLNQARHIVVVGRCKCRIMRKHVSTTQKRRDYRGDIVKLRKAL